MRSALCMVLLASCLSWLGAGRAPAGEDAAGLLEKTGVKGGICLLIGAKDAELPKALAAKSALYVQVLQPDAKLAAGWGAEFAKQECQEREKLGLRNAAFEADHYGSDLFNLIVVEDAAALGKAKLADLCRILVPNGFVAVKAAPAGFAEEAKALDMTIQASGAYAAVYRKPLKVEWKPTVALKWRAGSVHQYCSSFSGMTSGDGRMFYRERMEIPGTLGKTRAQLFARDAYNGRVLWTIEEPVGWCPLPGQWGVQNLGIEADDKGRLFVATAEGKFVCLDAATGKLRFELLPGKAGPEGAHAHGDFVFAYGKVFSAVDGKLLRAMPPPWFTGQRPMSLMPQPAQFAGPDSYYECDGKTLTTRKIADGQVLKSVTLEGLPPQGSGKREWFTMWFAVIGKYLIVGNASYLKIEKITVLDSSTGKLLWSHTVAGKMLTEKFGWNEWMRFMPSKDKAIIFRRPPGPVPPRGPHEFLVTRIDMATGKVEDENRSIEAPMWVGHCFGKWWPMDLGDYIAHFDVWIDKRTLAVTGVRANGACEQGPVASKGMGLIFGFPSRKNEWISANGPADPPAGPAPGAWKSLQRFGAPTAAEATREDDWTMFRNGPGRGNAGKAALGDKPVKAWEAAIGLGGRSYGVMCAERTGLTQAVSAYGLAIVSDIEGQRIVAVNAADGKQKWVFHVGSRVDYPPALHKGLCLFAAADGWVYCLDARTGAPVWKNLFAERERYVGGREALESSPPGASVTVVNGVGYLGTVAFQPETGEAAPAPGKLAVGRQLGSTVNWSGVDLLIGLGNSPPRCIEDFGGALFTESGIRLNGKWSAGRGAGRALAFDDALCVAWNGPRGERPDCAGQKWSLSAVDNDPKKPLWSTPPSEMIVDDILLAPQRIYCVGHYQQIEKAPELLVLAREDGKVLGTVPVEGFPAFFGMSAAGNRLFVSTREGKLICYQEAK